MKFYTIYAPKQEPGEQFTLPSVTVPDESMTIPEIIARFVRTGSMPVSFHSDIGDNEAFEPDFDPLDVQPDEILSDLRKSVKSPENAPKSDDSPKPDAEQPEK